MFVLQQWLKLGQEGWDPWMFMAQLQASSFLKWAPKGGYAWETGIIEAQKEKVAFLLLRCFYWLRTPRQNRINCKMISKLSFLRKPVNKCPMGVVLKVLRSSTCWFSKAALFGDNSSLPVCTVREKSNSLVGFHYRLAALSLVSLDFRQTDLLSVITWLLPWLFSRGEV